MGDYTEMRPHWLARGPCALRQHVVNQQQQRFARASQFVDGVFARFRLAGDLINIVQQPDHWRTQLVA